MGSTAIWVFYFFLTSCLSGSSLGRGLGPLLPTVAQAPCLALSGHLISLSEVNGKTCEQNSELVEWSWVRGDIELVMTSSPGICPAMLRTH